MSRTRKGSKGPGWEPWSNLEQKQRQRADYREDDEEEPSDECPGCRECICVACGGWFVAEVKGGVFGEFYCIECGRGQ